MPVDKFGRMSDTKTKDTGVSLTYINNNYVRSDGGTPLTGSLDMRGNTIYNVADPVNPQDVVTKVYVDNTKGSGVIGRKIGDSVSIKENLDFLGKQKIKNLPDPVNDKDAATKEYVDTTTIPFLKLDRTKYNTKGDIDMGDQFTVLNVKTPIDDNHITDKKYVDEMDNLKSAFSLKSGGYEAKGNIYLKKNKLGGLREPEQDNEPATKKYVDNLTKNLFLDENDNIAFGLNVDMDGNKIFSLPEPEQDNEPATKKYVDDLQTQYIDKRGNVKFNRNINVGNNRIFAVKDPKKDYEATNKKYVDESITKRIQEEKDTFLPQDAATKNYVDEAIRGLAGGDILVSKEGVFIKDNGHYRATAPLDIDNQKVENIPDPVDEKDAVNRKYIDEIVQNLTLKQGLLRENGGFNLVYSYINMNFNHIRNLGNPIHGADAVPRSFVDDMIKEVEEKRKYLIAVSTYYCGSLIKGEYQFPFGGNACEEAGFLMPQSGRIKKVKLEIFGKFKKYRGYEKFDDDARAIFRKEIFEELKDIEELKNIPDTDEEYEIFYNKIKKILFLGGDLFSIISFKNNSNDVNKPTSSILSTYRCFIREPLDYNPDIDFIRNCVFDNDLKNHPLSEGEVINIRTEIDRNVKSVFSFMFTFLIELDPLDD